MSKVNVLWQCKISVLDVTLNNCLVTNLRVARESVKVTQSDIGWRQSQGAHHHHTGCRPILISKRFLQTVSSSLFQLTRQNSSFPAEYKSFSALPRVLAIGSEAKSMCPKVYHQPRAAPLLHCTNTLYHCTNAPMQCTNHQEASVLVHSPVVVQWCAATSNSDAKTNMLMCILVAVLRCKLIPESRISLECTGGCHLDRLTPLMFDWLCGTTIL